MRGAVGITGAGAVTALGVGLEALLDGLWAGRVALTPPPADHPASPVGWLPGWPTGARGGPSGAEGGQGASEDAGDPGWGPGGGDAAGVASAGPRLAPSGAGLGPGGGEAGAALVPLRARSREAGPDPAAEDDEALRALALALAAAREALAGAGWDAEARAGAALVVATTKGTLAATLARLAGGAAPAPAPLSGLAPRLAAALGLGGPRSTVSVACASGLAAAGLARQLILRGAAPRALVVGVDALTAFVHHGFESLRALDPAGARPFDAARAGLSVGEGAVAVALERGPAPVRLVGYGASNDAHHITGPARDGAGLSAALEGALAEAQLQPQAVALAVLHGTGTRYNDAMEGEACARTFGPRAVPVTSVKGAVGHLMGGAGLLNLVVAAQALLRGQLPPVAGLAVPDPELPLDVVAGAPRPVAGRWAVASASGFAGVNAAVVLAGPAASLAPQDDLRWAASGAETATPPAVRAVVTAAVTLPPERAALAPRLDPRTARRLDDLCLFGLVAADAALAAAGLTPEALAARPHGLILGTSSGCLESDAAFEGSRQSGGPPPNPRIFAYTLPNIVLGELAIRHHLTGENLVLSAGRASGLAAVAEAAARVEAGEWGAALVLAVEVPGPGAARLAAPEAPEGRVVALVVEAEAAARARGARVLGGLRAVPVQGHGAVEAGSAGVGLDGLLLALHGGAVGAVHAVCPSGYEVAVEVSR
jgi:3-oxoacyl-(acyl-carrier-protein) synthase